MHIHKFQEFMRDLYFHRDNERGARGTYEWLTDEVEELGDALKANDRKGVEEEFADVLAWLASLANVLDVDLEKATLKKYDRQCPKCGFAPCRCSF